MKTEAVRSAASPPRETPTSAIRFGSTAGWAASHLIALAKYSSGMFSSDAGRPSSPK